MSNSGKRLHKINTYQGVAVGEGGGSVVAGWVCVLVGVDVGVKVFVGCGV